MSNQQNVRKEIERLSRKKRNQMSSRERVRLLQLKLYQKAKQQTDYRFYILYDKVFLDYILAEAYRRCKANAGSPGVDGKTFRQVEQEGRQAFLLEIKQALRKRTYRPDPVKRVWIAKENGGQRPLGIPTIRDRVVQQACKMIIEPIFEAAFTDSSYGFRPNRSAGDAIREIKQNLNKGKHRVYDADLSKYFDKIPHDKLMVVLAERIADPRLLDLIKLWLKTPIVEEDGQYTGGKRSTKGTPQGGVISPLLANIYMNLIDRILAKQAGYFDKQGIRMIRYADDFVLMGATIPQEAIDRLHTYLERMELTINETKSKLVDAKQESFDFLGFTIRYDRSIIRKGGWYWNIVPKAASQQKIRQKISSKLKQIGHLPADQVVSILNPMIQGWMNYVQIQGVSYPQMAFRRLHNYLGERIGRYYHRKSQKRSRLGGYQAYKLLSEEYGLVVPYKSSGLRPVKAQR